MEVTCIGQSAFKFDELQELITESQLRPFNDSKIKFTNHSGFLAVLASFKNTKPVEMLRNCGSYLKHVSFTFLVEGGPAGLEDYLDVSSFPDFKIVSGSVSDFKIAALECCRPGHQLQEVFSRFVKYFMLNGLAEVFNDIHKTSSTNGSLILARK